MSTINTDTINPAAYTALYDHDKRQIGTDAYLGLAPFWAYEYRYPMRDLSYVARRRIHHALLGAGLPLDGASRMHERVIRGNLTGQDRRRLAGCYRVRKAKEAAS